MSGSIGEKLRTKLRIPETRRKPLREQVSTMRVRVLRMPQDLKATMPDGTEVTPGKVMTDLNAAKTAIWSRAVTDAERRTSVTATQTLVTAVQPRLEKLAAASGALPRPTALDKPVATPKTIENGKTLTARLDVLLAAIRAKQATGYGHGTLLADEAGLRQRASEAIVSDAALAGFTAEIDAVKAKLDIAAGLGDFWAADKRLLQARLDTAANKLKPLAELLKGKGKLSDMSEEFDLLDTVRLVIGARPADVEVVRARLARLEGLVATASARPPAAYAAALVDGAERKARVAKDQATFRSLTGEPLRKLQELSRALGGDITALEGDYRAKLDTLGVPGAGNAIPDPKKEGDDFILLINAATRREGAKLATLRTDVATLDTAANTRMATLRTRLGTVPVLAVDWKQMNGMLTAFQQQKAGTDAATLESLSALQSAKALGTQLLAKLTALEAAPAQTAMTGFQTRADKMAADLKGVVAGEKSPLGRYFPDERTKFGTELKQFDKDLPTTPAAVAMKTFDVLERLLREKVAEAAAIDTAAKAAALVMEQKKKDYAKLRGHLLNRGVEEPNAVSMAIDDLKKTLETVPASKLAIETARTNLEGKMTASTTAAGLQGGVVAAKQAKADAEARTEATQNALKTRRREAAAAYADAKEAVNQVGGDKLALDAIGVLLDEADKQIKAGDEASATRTLDRIIQRADMLLANPEGEVNRQRKALC